MSDNPLTWSITFGNFTVESFISFGAVIYRFTDIERARSAPVREPKLFDPEDVRRSFVNDGSLNLDGFDQCWDEAVRRS